MDYRGPHPCCQPVVGWLLGTALVALVCSLSVMAQDASSRATPSPAYRVAWAEISTYPPDAPYFEAFRSALAQRGFGEGRLQLRAFGGPSKNRIPAILEWKPHAIVVVGPEVAKEFRKASASTPIIFTYVPDPVAAGIVESLSRPGGNSTGVSIPLEELAVKRVELVQELLPRARRVAILFDSRAATPGRVLSSIRVAAERVKLAVENVDAAKGLEAAISRIRRSKADAVLITGVLQDPRAADHLVRLQNDARIAVLDDSADSAENGMVLALGEDGQDHYRRAAYATAKVLEGESPSTIPVDVSTRIVLWVNAAAARKLDIRLPPSILMRADRVIQ